MSLHETTDAEHEPKVEEDVLPRRTVLAVMAVTVLITLAGLGWAWHLMRERSATLAPPRVATEHPPSETRPLPPAKIETSLFDQVDRYRNLTEHGRQVLSTYGWVEQDKGIVRIPIERAMELYVEGSR